MTQDSDSQESSTTAAAASFLGRNFFSSAALVFANILQKFNKARTTSIIT
jgi:hypothetical protein